MVLKCLLIIGLENISDCLYILLISQKWNKKNSYFYWENRTQNIIVWTWHWRVLAAAGSVISSCDTTN